MYFLELSKRYKKSYKRIAYSGKFPQEEIDFVVNQLLAGNTLDKKYRDHALSGNYKGYRECHIKPDLLLIYQIQGDVLVLLLLDIGSHSYLFK